MNFLRNLLIQTTFLLGLTSCYMTEQVGNLKVEVMKPGAFVYHEQVKKVAVFKRDFYKSDTVKFRYYNERFNVNLDSTISFSDLSNSCVDSLASFLKSEAYFREVRNFRDSLAIGKTGIWMTDRAEIAKRTDADMYIFLDFFNLNGTFVRYSSDYISTNAALSWQIGFKRDSVVYVYNQLDTLYSEGNYISNRLKLKSKKIRSTLLDFSKYLGKTFGTKVIPNWIPVDRMYYRSLNSNMKQAEQFALQNNWLKAAEFWRRETKSKNSVLIAKACFNMALAAEMAGEYDASIDWLIKSYSALHWENKDHKANCQQYINVLALRKKEIGLLDRQVRRL